MPPLPMGLQDLDYLDQVVVLHWIVVAAVAVLVWAAGVSRYIPG